MTYVELNTTSHFSFLRGVSSCEELFSAAAVLGYRALGITDRNSVAGLVRATIAADATNVRLIAGCRLDLLDGSSLLMWPQNRAAWSRLTRLLTLGKNRAQPDKGEKGQCFLRWEDIAAYSEGLVAALVPDRPDETSEIALAQNLCTLRRSEHAAPSSPRHHTPHLSTGKVLLRSPQSTSLCGH